MLTDLVMQITSTHQRGNAAPDLASLSEFVDKERLALIRQHVVNMPEVEINSRNIKQRIRENRSIRYQVPTAIEAYIRANRLYQ